MSVRLETFEVKQAGVLPENYIRNHGLYIELASDLISQKNNAAVISLQDNGIIFHCTKAAGELLGWAPKKLVRQPLTKLVPQLADLALVSDEKVSPYLRFLSMAGHRFEVIGKNGVHFFSELFFSREEADLNMHFIRVVFHPVRNEQAISLRHLRMG